jgi:hypothetical protein
MLTLFLPVALKKVLRFLIFFAAALSLAACIATPQPTLPRYPRRLTLFR